MNCFNESNTLEYISRKYTPYDKDTIAGTGRCDSTVVRRYRGRADHQQRPARRSQAGEYAHSSPPIVSGEWSTGVCDRAGEKG